MKFSDVMPLMWNFAKCITNIEKKKKNEAQ